MSDAGKRLIASASEALDLVKRLRQMDRGYPTVLSTAADIIEKLERELAAEKALADRLSGRLERKQVWSWCDSDDQALSAYRKARGLE